MSPLLVTGNSSLNANETSIELLHNADFGSQM